MFLCAWYNAYYWLSAQNSCRPYLSWSWWGIQWPLRPCRCVKAARPSKYTTLFQSGVSQKQGLSTDEVPDFDRETDKSQEEEVNWWNREPLRRLLLANNQLSDIDPRISQFQMLTLLDLSHNNFQTLPDAIGHCARLQKLLLRWPREFFWKFGIPSQIAGFPS